MKQPFTNRELIALLAVSGLSFLANMPEQYGHAAIDRRLLLGALVGVVVVGLFRHLQVLLLVIISVLAIGANLPNEIAHDLGISQGALLAALGTLIALTLLNRKLDLLPLTADDRYETPDTGDATLMGHMGHARQFMLTAIAKGDIATLRTLLAMKASVNFVYNGTTPLHLATEKGYSNIVKLLLDHGADFLAINAAGQTPLDVALAIKKFDRTIDILYDVTVAKLGQGEALPTSP